MHFHFFPYKCICNQIWPWPKIGQGHPRVSIYAIYDGPMSQMLHTKFHANRPSGSEEEDFWRVFTIYGHGGHLGHMTWTPYANFRSPIPWRLHMKFYFNQPSGSRGEDVWKCEHTTHTQTTALPYDKLTKWAFGSGELKMGSRSPKSNQHFSPSQWYICVRLAKICPFSKERVQTRGYAPFSNNLSPPVTFKMGSRSPKSNQHFSPSQWYICVSLAKICPFNKEIECRQVATPTPTGSLLKSICPHPPHPPSPPLWGDIIILTPLNPTFIW